MKYKNLIFFWKCVNVTNYQPRADIRSRQVMIFQNSIKTQSYSREWAFGLEVKWLVEMSTFCIAGSGFMSQLHFQFQVSNNAHVGGSRDNSIGWFSITHSETLIRCLAPDLTWPSPNHFRYLGSESTDESSISELTEAIINKAISHVHLETFFSS